MHWCISWCVDSGCWLTFTDALTYWWMRWIDMLVDFYWCIDVLVGMLSRHVGWHVLTDGLMCWLVCWVDLLVDVYWCADVLVDVLNRHANFELICATQLLWSVAFGYNKKQQKEAIHLLHIQSWLKPSYCCSHRKKYKT